MRNRRRHFTLALVGAGWLFADLLLALAVLFLAANTIGIQPTPNPTISPPVVSPTPISTPPLDLLNKKTIEVHNVDYTPLLTQNPPQYAIKALAMQIQAQVNSDRLQKHRAGLAIAYGIAVNYSPLQSDNAAYIAHAVYLALDYLARQKFLFFRDAKHYSSLFTYATTKTCYDLSCVIIDVYLFTQ
jgi:hypothetical protein